MNLNDKDFYYNELTHKIADEVIQGLNCGINFENLHFWWPYKKIKLMHDEEYLNLTYNVIRIKRKNWKDDDIRGSTGPDYCGYPHVHLEFLYKARKWIKNHSYDLGSVVNVVAHELHHAAQKINNINKYEDIEDIPRHMRENPYVKYFLNPYEVEAYEVGFRAESSVTGRTIEDCIERYLMNYFKKDLLTKEEYNKICVNWLNSEVKLVEVKK